MLRRRPKGPSGNPDAYEGLRALALGAVADGLAPPGPEHPHVWGVVVDVPSGGDWATIVALGDGTTSMYTSTGGGTIGAGEHDVVRAANRQLLEVVERDWLPHLDPSPGSHPAPGYVRFHVLGADDLRGIDVAEAIFWGSQPGGGSLVPATQQLIHVISQVSPS